MTLREELLSLKPMLGTDAPEFYDKVKSIAARYTSEEDKKEIADFIAQHEPPAGIFFLGQQKTTA